MQFTPVPEQPVDGLTPSPCAPSSFRSERTRTSAATNAVARILTLAMALLLPSMSRADQLEELAKQAGIRVVTKGESSSDLQKRTAAALPMNQMSAENRKRVSTILDDCNQYRRLPTLQYTVDEPMYRYLLQHPDVAVSTWRVMGISRFEMWQTGPMEYEAQAVDGSEGLADILYQDKNQMLFVCEGLYHNPVLLKPLQASALVWFRSSFGPNAEGTHVVSQRADVFVRFPSNGLSAVAKVLTPITNSLMDRNLFEISLYSSMMSRAVRDEPEWVIQVAQQMEGVLPQRKEELVAVARQPRRGAGNGKGANAAPPATDRKIVMSPQLLFFDPPKDGTSVVPGQATISDMKSTTLESAAVSAKTVSASNTNSTTGTGSVPAQTASASRPVRVAGGQPATESSDKPAAQSDDELALQPVLPPAGSTATDPAGSSPTAPAPR